MIDKKILIAGAVVVVTLIIMIVIIKRRKTDVVIIDDALPTKPVVPPVKHPPVAPITAVTLYEKAGQKGKSYTLPVGKYSMIENKKGTTKLSFDSGKIMSVTVPAGMRLRVMDQGHLTQWGAGMQEIIGPKSTNIITKLNNKISSMIVDNYIPQGDKFMNKSATNHKTFLYSSKDPNGGASWVLEPGHWNSQSMQAPVGVVLHAKVPEGYKVILYTSADNNKEEPHQTIIGPADVNVKDHVKGKVSSMSMVPKN